MSTLGQMLTTLSESISELKQQGKPVDELDIKTVLVEPLLAALGWNTANIYEVIKEFKLHRTHAPVDYALRLRREPCLLIETKTFQHPLNDLKWIEQSVKYAKKAGANWYVLTNGDTYHIYRTDTPLSSEDNPFKTPKISAKRNRLEVLGDFALLTKENLKKGVLDSQWKEHFAHADLKDAIIETFRNPPSSVVIAIKEKTRLAPSEIRDFMTKAKIEVFPPENH